MATRPQIRSAITELIRPLVKTAFSFKPHAIDPSDLPCAFVYLEAGDTRGDFDDAYASHSILMIEMMVAGMGDLDSELDGYSDLINTQIKAQNELAGLVDGIERTGFAYDRDPESFSSTLTLTFQISYNED